MNQVPTQSAPSIDHSRAKLAYHAIVEGLSEDEKTRDPMNALVVWTELGRGLSGTLDKKGAEPGKLRGIVAAWCRTREVDGEQNLGRWTYRVPAEKRLDAKDIGAAMRRVMRRLEEAMPELTTAAENDGEKSRELFFAVVRGWFPVGVVLFEGLPSARQATKEARLAALGAWCERYLPKDDSSPRELGVRMVRE